MPDHPIEKCKADIGLLSYIIVGKFPDHLPLYRQDGIFEREGVDIPRATQTSWVLQIYDAIRLGEELKRAVLESDVIFTDDSITPLQVKGNGRVKKARLWAYVRGGNGPPLTGKIFLMTEAINGLWISWAATRATSMRMPTAVMMSSSARKASLRSGAGCMQEGNLMRPPPPVLRRPRRSWLASPGSTRWKRNVRR